MRDKHEVRELEQEISKLNGFIADFGEESEFQSSDVTFSCNVADALCWVLGEISTERFGSDAYLDLAHLREVASQIETRTGKKLEEYE